MCKKVRKLLVFCMTGAMIATSVVGQAIPIITVYAKESITEELRAEIEASLYDFEYYCMANEDVAIALNYDEDKMYEHWLNFGMAEGRNASMVFNAKYYLEVNPSVKAEVGEDYVAAYEHFVTTGLLEGLESSPVFSVKYYLQANQDVARVFGNDYIKVANHFNQNALAEGRSGSGNFDYTVYKNCNTDVLELYGDEIKGYYIHYINHGRAEGRTAGLGTSGDGGNTGGNIEIDETAVSYRIFDAEFYLENYPELGQSVGTEKNVLYTYWMEEGIALGQSASPIFDPAEYLTINTDVAKVVGQDYEAATNHFLNYGIYEGRSGNREFDYTVYKDCNTDVVEVFGEDIVGYYFHYVKYGKDENRTATLGGSKPIPTLKPTTTPEQIIEGTEGYFSYKIQDGEVTIIRFKASNQVTEAIIPKRIQQYPVTRIGEYAFADYPNLISIELPDSVISIGDYAFYNCSDLNTIELPDSVISIGSYVFANCSDLNTIELPDSVTSIGEEAFSYCDSLISIKLPDSVISIGDKAFYSCDSLSSIELGNSVTNIGDYAFSICNRLSSVELGNSVTNIGHYAFYGCDISRIKLPDSVTSIGKEAFSCCYRLSSIKLPNSVTSIGKEAFYGCNNLTITTPINSYGENYAKSHNIPYNNNFSGIKYGKDSNSFNKDIVGDCNSTIATILIFESDKYTIDDLTIVSSNDEVVKIDRIEIIDEYIPEDENEYAANIYLNFQDIGNVNITITAPDGTHQSVLVISQNVELKAYVPFPKSTIGINQEVKIQFSLYVNDKITTIGECDLEISNPFVVKSIASVDVDGSKIFTLRGLNIGSSDLIFTEKSTGKTVTISITIEDKSNCFNCSLFPIPYESVGSIYVADYSCIIDENGNHNVTFNAYNTSYAYGVVEVYDEYGTLVKLVPLDPRSDGSGMEKVVNGFKWTWEDIKGLFGGDMPFYMKESNAKHTPVKLENISENAKIVITSDGNISDFAALYVGVDVFVRTVFAASSIDLKIEGQSKTVQELMSALGESLMTSISQDETEKLIKQGLVKEAAKNISTTIAFSTSSIDSVSDIYETVNNLLQSLDIDVETIMLNVLKGMGYSVADGLFTTAVPFYKIAILVDQILEIVWPLADYSFNLDRGKMEIFIFGHDLEDLEQY